MTATLEPPFPGRASRWRLFGWGAAATLLAAPLVAMQFTAAVNWSVGDFIFAAMMFGLVGLLIELAARVTKNSWFRGGASVGVLAGLLIIWVNGAVGMIGDEDNPANLLFFLSILIALLGSVAVRFRAPAMAWPMFAAGSWQAGVAIVAGIFGSDMRGGLLTVALSGLWFLSGALFRQAGQA